MLHKSYQCDNSQSKFFTESEELKLVTELEDDGEDLIVKIFHLFLWSPQPLKFIIWDLKGTRAKKEHLGCFLLPIFYPPQWRTSSLTQLYRQFERSLMVIFIKFPDAYLHDLVAHPAQVPPFRGLLPQQVMRVVAESALTIQTQGHSAQGHGGKRDTVFV